jgi:hypothetical protein
VQQRLLKVPASMDDELFNSFTLGLGIADLRGFFKTLPANCPCSHLYLWRYTQALEKFRRRDPEVDTAANRKEILGNLQSAYNFAEGASDETSIKIANTIRVNLFQAHHAFGNRPLAAKVFRTIEQDLLDSGSLKKLSESVHQFNVNNANDKLPEILIEKGSHTRVRSK